MTGPAIQRLLDVMRSASRSLTRKELEAELGATTGYTSQLVHRAHKVKRLIHISGYSPTRGEWAPRYSVGDRPDALMPRRATTSEAGKR